MRSPLIVLFAVTILAYLSVVKGAGYFTIGYHALYQNSYIPAKSIEYNKLTHIALAAVSTTSSGTIIPSDGATMANWQSFVNTVTAYAHGNGTKTILMFGGSSAISSDINAATSDAIYATFASNLVAHAQSLQFDGIDLDWESNVNFPSLTRLAKTIRQLWPSVFLTFPTGILGVASGNNDPSNYLPMMPYLDAVNMMSYSPPGNWGGWDGPWHVSPLTGNTANHPYSISLALSTMLSKQIPKSKIGIGMAFFGSCWGTPITKPVQSLGSNNIIATDNDMSYKNIEASYKPQMREFWDATAQVPYLNSSTAVGPKGCSYISYDNDASIKAKADYVKSQGLSGIVIWTVGEGILANGANPALTSVQTYFGRSYAPILWPSSTSTSTSTTGASTTGSASYANVYSDGLSSGWLDGSWAPVNLANTNPVHSGSKSASFIPQNWQALYFYSSPAGFINPAIHDGVEFYINGGSTGGQNIIFDITKNSQRVSGFSKVLSTMITGGIPANAWARGYISFSTLPAGNYDGMWFEDNTGGTQGVLYIDDVRIKLR